MPAAGRSIEGVPTSVAGFVGPTRFGPVTGKPEPLTSFAEFERFYGGLDDLTFAGGPHPNDLAHAVRGFFENGGQKLYVARVYEPSADGRARCEVRSDDPGATPMVLRARHPGEVGNFAVTFEAQAAAGAPLSEVTLAVTISNPGSPAGDRVWQGLHPEPDHPSGSLMRTFPLELDDPATHVDVPLVVEGPGLRDGEAVLERLFGSPTQLTADLAGGAARARFELRDGTDGLRPGVESFRSGLLAFEDLEDVSIVAAPGSSRGGSDGYASESRAVARLLAEHCERMAYRVAVLDSPDSVAPAEALSYRDQLDSSHAAYYYPWIEVLDPVTGSTITTPPSGFVAGIYARTDVERGVHKAPANQEVRLAVGLEQLLDDRQQDVLNPAGVNCLRYFEGRGYLVWGARTISSDPEWKYVSIRRYFAYLERSIEKGTQWAVFEPNGEPLWADVRRTVEDFLFTEFRSGRLQGGSPDEAFFVKCDRTTMTQNDIDNGRLVCLVGVAATRPAEFVIFRIGQWTRDAQR